MFEGMIKVFVHDKEELDELVVRLKQLNGIHEVQSARIQMMLIFLKVFCFKRGNCRSF